MASKPEETLTRLQEKEEAQRAKFAAQRKSLLTAEAKRKAAQKQWQESRWLALGQVVEACLGTQVTAEVLRARLEQGERLYARPEHTPERQAQGQALVGDVK